MEQKTPKPKTIDEYIFNAPPASQEKLLQLCTTIRKAAPGATESLKWSMPAFSLDRILVTFAVFKNHIGYYTTPSTIAAFAKELADYSTAKGSVQFPLNQRLPVTLISKMTKFRVQESVSEDVKWKS